MKSVLLDVSIFGSLAAFITYAFAAVTGWKASRRTAASVLLAVSTVCLALFFGQRWMDLGRPPLITTFEVLVFLAGVLMIVFLVMERVYKASVGGPFVSAIAMLTLIYATLLDERVKPVIPALRENFWLTVHVALCFVAYAALIFASIAAVLHLYRIGNPHRRVVSGVLAWTAGLLIVVALYVYGVQAGAVEEMTGGKVATLIGMASLFAGLALLWPLNVLLARVDSAVESEGVDLDKIVYRAVLFGFPFLALGIITGAVWANGAWGRYWGWDPKETWSLVTWLLYFLYLHFRYMKNWRGPRASWVVVMGFYSVVFTFFGVNYLLPGLHSYL